MTVVTLVSHKKQHIILLKLNIKWQNQTSSYL